MNKLVWLGILVILIVVVYAVAMYRSPSVKPAASSFAPVSFQLTDPPVVPNGTQALTINYSSVNAHVIYTNGTSAWISATGSGSVNLMSIVNLSQVIAHASIPFNSIVDLVRFNVTSSHITINNVTYNVTLPNNMVTAHILNANRVNNSTSILLDLTPVIATIYTNNSTVFVMVPSLRAVAISGNSAKVASGAAVGAKLSINSTAREELEKSKANISITSAALAVNGNLTSLSVTVKNDENSSVNIRHIMLFGNESVTIATDSAIPINITKIESAVGSNELEHAVNEQVPNEDAGFDFGFGSGMSYNLSHEVMNLSTREAENISMNMSEIGKMLNSSIVANIINESKGMNQSSIKEIIDTAHRYMNISIGISRLKFLNASQRLQEVRNIIRNMSNSSMGRFDVGVEAEHMRMLTFFVANNSTSLVLPFADHEFENTGYTLNAGSSATFTFNGIINYANGHITISPIAGNSYKIVVQGEDSARATINLTAS